MALGIFLVVVILIVGIIGGIYRNEKRKKLIDEGIMAERGGFFDFPFYQMESTFTLQGDWNTVWGALRQADYHGSILSVSKLKGLCAAEFKADFFAARITEMEYDSETMHLYKFRFTRWKSRKGVTYSVDSMNILLTTVEKTLLSIDPNTQVSTKRANFHTKSDIL